MKIHREQRDNVRGTWVSEGEDGCAKPQWLTQCHSRPLGRAPTPEELLSGVLPTAARGVSFYLGSTVETMTVDRR